MPRKMPCVQSKRGLSLLPMLALSFLFAQVQQASASSFAAVNLFEPASGDFLNASSDTAIAAVANLGPATGSAQSVLSTGSLGVELEMLPGSPLGIHQARADWRDTWTGGVGGGTVPVAASFTLDGSFTTNVLPSGNERYELSFSYSIDDETFLRFELAARNGQPFRVDAFYVPDFSNAIDLTDLVILTPNVADPTLTDFSFAFTPIVQIRSAGFSDSMAFNIRVNGPGPMTIDSFNTARVELTSLDPGVTFTSESGRTIATVPEPATFAMLLSGLALLGCTGRRREQSGTSAV